MNSELSMNPIITHFTDDDLYKFSMCCAILNCYPRAMVRYRFMDRNKTRYSFSTVSGARERQL